MILRSQKALPQNDVKKAVILSEAKDHVWGNRWLGALCRVAKSEQEMKTGYVYIMANDFKTLYTGVTSSLRRRVFQHRQELVEGFTKKYSLTKLVYIESIPGIREAIAREKQIKGWLRAKKIALIEKGNPNWEDLSSTIGA